LTLIGEMPEVSPAIAACSGWSKLPAAARELDSVMQAKGNSSGRKKREDPAKQE
jgi:hypothetical protein